jgi:hypothetical protein
MTRPPRTIFRCVICLVAGLVHVSSPAASQVTTANGSIPKAFTVESAPEPLVYRFFFGEVAASQKRADELEAQGKSALLSHTRYQKLLGLSASESQWFREVVTGIGSTWNANKRQRAELARTAQNPEDRQRIQWQLAALRQQDDQALADGIGLLRTQFGSEGFSRLDSRIRQYVVPNIKLLSRRSGPPPATVRVTK